MSTEQDVSRTVYERWPLGATRQIERLESKIRETCDFMSGQVTEVLDYLEVYKPSDEVLKKDVEQRKIWKEVSVAKTAIKNRIRHIYPKPFSI